MNEKTTAKLLLVSTSTVGRQMAGPAIRYWNFACHLAKRFQVTLMTPNHPDLDPSGFDVVVGRPNGRGFLHFARQFDVVIAQQLGAFEMRALTSGQTRVIYDLYAPFLPETLGLVAPEADKAGPLVLRLTQLAYEISLRCGDAFICASERQRDYWLGALGEHGRLALSRYRGDPTLRRLIDVVPFGLDPSPPPVTAHGLKGVVPGINSEDRVVIWAGGIWNWFDPLTLIRAVARIAERRSDVKLFFLGLRHPDPGVREMEMTRRALELAEKLDLENRYVFFNYGWTPYDQRAKFLMDADLGVSCHFANIETRFAFRTRLLDYFWAGLPTVTTEGDVLADLVEERGLGRTVPAGDVDALQEAIEGLLDDHEERERAKRRLVDIREELAWPTVVGRLGRIIDDLANEPRPRRRTALLLLRYIGLALRLSMVSAEGRRALFQRARLAVSYTPQRSFSEPAER